MKIAVSSCLLGINCKYNGKSNYNEEILKLKEIIENQNILKTKERLALHLGLYLSKEIIHAHFGRMILNIFPHHQKAYFPLSDRARLRPPQIQLIFRGKINE